MAGGLCLTEIVARLGGKLLGDSAGCSVSITQVASLQSAEGDQIAFLAKSKLQPKYLAQLKITRAGAVIMSPDAIAEFDGPRIVCEDPVLYFARVSHLLNSFTHVSGSHVDGCISNDAFIDTDARIGEATVIGAGSVIGKGVQIGAGSLIYPNVTIYDHCIIGERAIIHAGAVIGADGFGFAREKDASWVKIPQIGRVIIGDDVEIGANTTIDRGALDDTVIGNGVKLDNQIQIAHNVCIGDHTAIAGCVGIAGSTQIGCRCTIAGAAMIIGHLTIVDDVHISVATLVTKSILEAGVYSSGIPCEPHREWLKNVAHIRRSQQDSQRSADSMMAAMRAIRSLEARLTELEKKNGV